MTQPTVVSVTDIRKEWSRVEKLAAKNDVYVLKNNKIVLKISKATAVASSDVILTPVQKRAVTMSRKQIKAGKGFKGNHKEVMAWLQS